MNTPLIRSKSRPVAMGRLGRFLAAALLAGTSATLAQETSPDAPPQANAVLEQARAWNITTCADAIGFISDFITGGSIYDTLQVSGPNDPDKEMFSATIALDVPQHNATGWATLSAAPVAAGACNISYTMVESFEESCEQTRDTYFSAFTNSAGFGQSAGISTYQHEGVTLSLMPAAGGGCVSMRQEFLY